MDRLDKESIARLIFFENMIINADWSVPIVHNIKIISLSPFYPPIPIPYDFDWAGIIDIPYSTHLYTAEDGQTPIWRFKGACLDRQTQKHTIDLFNDKREAIYSLYKNFELLDKSQLERILKSYDNFYNMINSPVKLYKKLKFICK